LNIDRINERKKIQTETFAFDIEKKREEKERKKYERKSQIK